MPEHGWVAGEKGEGEGRRESGRKRGERTEGGKRKKEKGRRERGEGEREGGKREKGEKGKEERETFSHVGNEVNAGTGWDPLLSTAPHPSHPLVISCHGYTLH